MQDASQEQHGVFSPAVRNYALGVLVVVYTFNFIDRQILSILLEPIKQDLGLSDSALGMLTGFAFALFYATLGIPIARFADRPHNTNSQQQPAGPQVPAPLSTTSPIRTSAPFQIAFELLNVINTKG